MRVGFHGGPVLSSAEVVAVFLGRTYATSAIGDWSMDPSLREQSCHINDFLRDVVDSAYLDGLSEYTPAETQTIGRGHLLGTATLPFANPNAQYGTAQDLWIPDAEIRAGIEAGFAKGALPPAAVDRAYIVFLPPYVGFLLSDKVNSSKAHGYHSSFELEGMLVPYAVIGHPGANPTIPYVNPATFDHLTVVASHELIEMILNPTTAQGWGWYDQSNGQETVDVCVQNNFAVWDRYHGYLLSTWWSERAQTCQMAGEDGLAKPARTATVEFLGGGSCHVPPALGSIAEFAVHLTPAPHPPLAYEWQCAGAVVAGPVDQATFQVEMPTDQQAVTISVTVDDSERCRVKATVTITAVSAEARAFLEHLCELRTFVHRNFLPDPLWDPLRDLTTLPIAFDDVRRLKVQTKDLSTLVDRLHVLHEAAEKERRPC